jgi:hypothetical protein
MNHCQLPSSSHVHVCGPLLSSPSFPGRFPLWSNKHLSSISSVIDRLRALRQGPVAMSLLTNGAVRCTSTSLSHLLQWLRCCATDQIHLVSKAGQLDRTSQFRRASLLGPSAFHKSATSSPWRSKHAGRTTLPARIQPIIACPSWTRSRHWMITLHVRPLLTSCRKGEIVLKPNSCRPFSSPS